MSRFRPVCAVCEVRPAFGRHHLDGKNKRGEHRSERTCPICAACHNMVHEQIPNERIPFVDSPELLRAELSEWVIWKKTHPMGSVTDYWQYISET